MPQQDPKSSSKEPQVSSIDQPQQTAHTVDQLFRMIAGMGNTSGEVQASRPPPVPPKPKPPVASRTSVYCNPADSLKKYFSTSLVNNFSTTNSSDLANVDCAYNYDKPPTNSSHTRKFTVTEATVTPVLNDKNHSRSMNEHEQQSMEIDGVNLNHYNRRPLQNTSLYQQQQQYNAQQPAAAASRFLYASIDDPADICTQKRMTNYGGDNITPVYSSNHHRLEHHDHQIKPIVTEYNDEANNNNVNNNINNGNEKTQPSRTKNITTVEILEVPLKHSSLLGISANTTFSRSPKQQKLFYENNNPQAVPFVNTSTDEDEEFEHDEDDNEVREHQIEDILLPTTRIEVNKIPHQHTQEQSPRTSTPNRSRNVLNAQNSSNAASFMNASVANDNYVSPNNSDELYHRANAYINKTAPEDNNDILHTDDDLNNLSRDDNTPFNQSGGCELIGVFETSDKSNTSKDSHRINQSNDSKLPYTVEVFNETLLRQQDTESQFANSRREHLDTTMNNTHIGCEIRIKELEELTKSMQEKIDKLNEHVTSLTAKHETLESLVSKQQVDLRQFSYQDSLCSSLTDLGDGLSKSSSTINRTSGATNSQNNGATYARSHVSTITRNPVSTSNLHLSNSTNLAQKKVSNRYQSSHSTTNNAKTLKKANLYASASSLYADGARNGHSSISPTQTNRAVCKQLSTSVMSNTTMPVKRDNLYNSVLSLSSLGLQSTGSTLKKSPIASGSILNLSPSGSQLSSWPSLSNFVTAKQQAKDIIYSEDERLIRMVLYNTLISMHVPTWAGRDYHLDTMVDPPDVKLKLSWVYGYRGRDCRSNVFFLPTGECVYFVASIIVLYQPHSKTQRYYLGHTDSVKCIAIHPNKLIVASGQSATLHRADKRPVVRIWNSVSLATLRVITFNQDFDQSICCMAFSKHDQGDTLVVVDESNEHTITLLDWQREKNWRIAEANSGHEVVLAIDFHPIDKYSLVAVGKSSVNFWDVRGLTLSKKAGLFDKFDKPKYVLCLAFDDNGDTITGDSNGNIIIWPRRSNRPQKVIHDAHPNGVFSVLAMKDGSYLTGGRDRRIVEWDQDFVRTGRETTLAEHLGGVRFITHGAGPSVLVGTLRNCILMGSLDTQFTLIMQGHSEAISALAVHPTFNQYLTGGIDEQIHMFDANSHDVIWTKCLMTPITSASFSPGGGAILILGSIQGKWIVVDSITQESLFTKCDGVGTIHSIKFSPNGEYFALGSSDMRLYIYQVSDNGSKFYQIGSCVGHSGPIKEIDWSQDSRYIQSQSMNLELLYWNSSECKQIQDLEFVSELNWSTHNCILGFNVFGIWSDSCDSPLVNHCDKSNDETILASATDTGGLNVFKWPPCYDKCSPMSYNGYVDKFNFIKFLNDDSKLIAVGSKSCVTTEWTVEKEKNS